MNLGVGEHGCSNIQSDLVSTLPLRRRATYTSNCAVAPEDRESSLVTCWRQLSDAQSWPSDVRLEMGCDDHSTLAGKKGNEGTMLSRAWDVFAFHSSL